MQLQSTSDQQDYLRYPPIAVSAPMSVLPEQSASWAYPQPDMTGEDFAFTLCTGLLGRLYLSGRLDVMTGDQLASVRAAVEAHQEIRAGLTTAVPLWPLGLPAWTDPWLEPRPCAAATSPTSRCGSAAATGRASPWRCRTCAAPTSSSTCSIRATSRRGPPTGTRANLTLTPTGADLLRAALPRHPHSSPIPAPTEGTAR